LTGIASVGNFHKKGNHRVSKPTVHDIAEEASVSLATVDRVLNERPGVRQQTIDKVLRVAEALGYVRDTSAANLARQRQYRFAFVLPAGSSQFVDGLEAALSQTAASRLAERTVVDTHRVPQRDPHAIVRALRSLDPTKFDGVALMVPETPQVRDAVARLKEGGLSVVTLVSDLPNSPRDFFIGVDSVAAGRTASLLMGRFVHQPGEILVVTNSVHTRDSLERRYGFDDLITREFPDLEVLPSVEAQDDPERMMQIIHNVIAHRARLVGIYSVGSGNSALLSALRATPKAKSLWVIAHELTPATEEALLADEVAAVIAHNVGHLVRGTLRALRSLCDDLPIFEAQEQVRIEVLLRENMT
jgi:LacI family transcriptional regulator